MASTSSLLKSAASMRAKAQEFQDSQVAYEWQQSAKTYEDFLAYSGYLSSQSGKTTDPTKQFGYTKAIGSARTGYVSNEIQRQSINVIEGGQDNIGKYNSILGLYHSAAEEGQYDLAQGLRLQLDNLSVTIQNEQEAAMKAGKEASSRLASSMEKLNVASLQDAVTAVKGDMMSAVKQFQQLGASTFNKRLQEYNVEGGDLFGVLANAASSLVQTYNDAISVTSDPDHQRQYQIEIAKILGQDASGNPYKQENIVDLPGVGGITYHDIIDNAKASEVGQTLFRTIKTGSGVQFQRNKEVGYTWGRDADGNYRQIPILNNHPDYTSSVKDGKNMAQYGKLLKDNGFKLTSEGGFITLANDFSGVANKLGDATLANQLNSLGLDTQDVQVYVDRNGMLQIKNGDKSYALQFDSKTGKYSGLQEQTPNPITLLGDQFQQPYVRANVHLDQLNAGTIGVIDSTSPYARSTQPGAILARGESVQLQNQKRLALQAPAPIAPAPINVQPQHPINVMSAPANTNIGIAQPQRLPNLTIAAPKPLPNLTVSNKPNTQSIKVNNQPNNQTIRI